MFQTHWEEVGYVCDHCLKLGVIKPRKFAYLSKEQYHHSHHLLVNLQSLVGQEVEQIILDCDFLIDRYLTPVVPQQVF